MLHSCRADAISVSMENAAETIAPVDGRSRHHRSALTNGNRLFVLEGNADGRSASYRRFKDVLEQILADMGGAEHLSEAQRQLCRRAATLSIAAEAMESDAIGNKPFDVDLYGQLTDRLGRCQDSQMVAADAEEIENYKSRNGAARKVAADLRSC